MDADGRLQTLRGLPRTVTNPGDRLAVRAGWMQRQTVTIHRQREAVAAEAARFDLEAFDGTIHITHRRAAAGLFAEDVPRLERGAEFDLYVALGEVADARETEFEVRREPVKLERIARIAQIANDVLEIGLAEMREHPAIVNVGAPAHQSVRVWL